MRTETTTRTIYTYNELSETAKARARDWFRNDTDQDYRDIYDDANTLAN